MFDVVKEIWEIYSTRLVDFLGAQLWAAKLEAFAWLLFQDAAEKQQRTELVTLFIFYSQERSKGQ